MPSRSPLDDEARHRRIRTLGVENPGVEVEQLERVRSIALKELADVVVDGSVG
jgi:hypothetical protein